MSSNPDSSECAFCRIVRGEASAEIVAEEEAWVAFLPLDPATEGHTLVVPRRHVPDLWAVDMVLGGQLMEAVVRVGKAIQVGLRPEGMNLITSKGGAAEQTVFHLHLHVLPRWRDDSVGQIWPDNVKQQRSPGEIAKRIREALTP